MRDLTLCFKPIPGDSLCTHCLRRVMDLPGNDLRSYASFENYHHGSTCDAHIPATPAEVLPFESVKAREHG